MPLKSEVLRALQAAGATLEMVLCAIEAAEREEHAKAERRRGQTAARVRKHRAERRNACNALPPLPPPDGPPLPPAPPSPPLNPPRSPCSDPDGSAPQAGAGRIDFRKDLFERGVQAVRSLTGRPEAKCRALVGSWLGLVQDEAAAVLAAIDAAAEGEVIEPVAWIEARLKRRRAEAACGRQASMVGSSVAAADSSARNDAAMQMALRGEWPVGGRIFVAADSPEGDAWERHYQGLGQGAKWRALRDGYGGMMPSLAPPTAALEMAGSWSEQGQA